METFLYEVLNKASRAGDETKVDTLGPFSMVLGAAIGFAA